MEVLLTSDFFLNTRILAVLLDKLYLVSELRIY